MQDIWYVDLCERVPQFENYHIKISWLNTILEGNTEWCLSQWLRCPFLTLLLLTWTFSVSVALVSVIWGWSSICIRATWARRFLFAWGTIPMVVYGVDTFGMKNTAYSHTGRASRPWEPSHSLHIGLRQSRASRRCRKTTFTLTRWITVDFR